MLALLKSNLLLSPFILFGLALILRSKRLLETVSYELNGFEGPLFKWVHQLIAFPYIEQLAVTCLIFGQSYLVNQLVMRNNLMRPPSYLPAFFYIFFASIAYVAGGFSPAILAMTFVILGVAELFKIYKLFKSAIHIFNAGLFFSIASLIYTPCLLFYFACSIIILILRSYILKERLQLLLGFLTPIYLIVIYFYMTDRLFTYWQENVNLRLNIHDFKIDDAQSFASLGLCGIFIFISTLYYRQATIKKGIQVEKKLSGLYWLMVFAFFSQFIAHPLELNHLGLLALPLSILIASIVINIKQTLFLELIGLFCITSCILVHYYL